MAQLEVKLPSLGEDAGDEARVSFWYVDVGDEVEEGQDLIQMLTDKATFDIPAPRKGRVAEQVAQENAEVKVGQVLCVMEVPD